MLKFPPLTIIRVRNLRIRVTRTILGYQTAKQQTLVMSNKHLLIIDDNQIDLLILKRNIELSGYKGSIKEFTNQQDAEEYLASLHQSGSDFPQLIFVDLFLINGSSAEFIKQLGSKYNGKVKRNVIVLSATINPNAVKEAESIPCVRSFIGKPLTLDTIKQHVQHL